MPRLRIALTLLLALWLSAAACSRSGTTDGTGVTAPEPGTTGAGEPSATGPGLATGPDPATGSDAGNGSQDAVDVPQILRFETALVGGGTLKGADLAGAPVALWFWAPW